MSDTEQAWLDQLESTVKQAAETIEALRGEKDDLARRAEELEGRIAELEAAGGSGKGKGKAKAKADEAAAWQRERKEIRRRVQKLTERLEGLLEG